MPQIARIPLAATALLLPAAAAGAQPVISWYSIEPGGGASTGGPYTLTATIGHPNAGPALAAGGYSLRGGFWPGVAADACPADWDASGQVNSNDISAFLSAWLTSIQTGALAADFDGSGQVNSNDISAFLTAWLDAVQNGC